MTTEKLEPFAVVVEYKETGRPYRVEVGGVEMEGGSSPAHSEFLARLVNDAFSKRLDEEIAKAVEEFRNKASVAAWKTCAGKCGGVPVCEIAEKILALPTEPEVEKWWMKVVHYGSRGSWYSACGFVCATTSHVWSRVNCKVCLRARGKITRQKIRTRVVIAKLRTRTR